MLVVSLVIVGVITAEKVHARVLDYHDLIRLTVYVIIIGSIVKRLWDL